MERDQLVGMYPGCVFFKFGDNEELSSSLIALVRSRKKVATCGALRDFDSGEEPMPEVGRIDIALNWEGTPALAIKTTEVSLVRFCDVEEPFALAEGEDETLEGWREGHQRYFERNGGFSPEMTLVCERFELVEDFASDE